MSSEASKIVGLYERNAENYDKDRGRVHRVSPVSKIDQRTLTIFHHNWLVPQVWD
jgi:hypothetical protein